MGIWPMSLAVLVWERRLPQRPGAWSGYRVSVRKEVGRLDGSWWDCNTMGRFV